MMFNPGIHHRHSIRFKGYDYTQDGVYFVTICAWERECLFGDIADGIARLSEIGKIVREEWMRTPVLRSNVELDTFVVMPNHFHAIFGINNSVGAHCVRPNSQPPNGFEKRAHVSAPLRRQPDSVGSIIAGFKSAVTKRINEQRGTPKVPVWQRNYYEHVVRDDNDLAAIRQYIADNPAKWTDDQHYPM